MSPLVALHRVQLCSVLYADRNAADIAQTIWLRRGCPLWEAISGAFITSDNALLGRSLSMPLKIWPNVESLSGRLQQQNDGDDEGELKERKSHEGPDHSGEQPDHPMVAPGIGCVA